MEPITFIEEIKGQRIILKKEPFTFEQAEKGFEIINRCRDDLMVGFYDEIEQITSPEAYFEKELISGKKNWNNNDAATYMITLDNKFIGIMAMTGIYMHHKNKAGQFHYWLDSNYTGHGYINEAVKLMENYFFNTGFTRIEICMMATNPKSINVAEKAGYLFEGREREEVYERNKTDDLRYSKLKSDWIKQNGNG